MKSTESSPKAECAIISFCTAAQTYPNTDQPCYHFVWGLKVKLKKNIYIYIPYPEGKDNLKLCSKKHEKHDSFAKCTSECHITIRGVSNGQLNSDTLLGFYSLFVPGSSADSRNGIKKCIKVYINSV